MLALVSGAVKVTTAPATGSPKALVRVACSGANRAPTGVAWLSPAVTVSVNPRDSNAPMSTMPLMGRLMPRWSVTGAPKLVPASMARLLGSKANVFVGPL